MYSSGDDATIASSSGHPVRQLAFFGSSHRQGNTSLGTLTSPTAATLHLDTVLRCIVLYCGSVPAANAPGCTAA